ncbi:hypothetical protein CLV28_1143 [Sediminihabitans luteus]|uniref:ATP-binding protein n=1 Tax=Sediminihabitans luteus TaxID=1138585 RepID=A0A2M9D1A7_9CELL|nr:DUF4143 domain-containing protein [Sediminihabitans luteus]PJJ77917.1 hypothetical protein CLV28_1143 [Sediminihabitans luteus]GII99726.1 ATPase AAA [Sediminihabitans luteus]
MTYLPRIVDERLAELVGGLPAVAVEGPKAVGKTRTASRLVASTIALDDPDEVALLAADRGRLHRLPKPVLIDEWQRHPAVWDMVRRAVDDGAGPGSFVLTGSATPSAPRHSGAGRIMSLRMRPLAFSERGLERPTVSLGELLSGSRPEIAGASSIALDDYVEEIVASGLPGVRTREGALRAELLDGYVSSIVEHDFAELGHVVRRPASLRSWFAAFAAATSSTATYSSILDAATAGLPEKPAKSTTIAYRDTLARLWILDELPAWLGPRNHLAALTQAPKHHLADPALAARLLNVGAGALLDGSAPARGGALLGALFESLVTMSVRVLAEASRARVSHLRTKRGEHEVDLVVERDDGRVLAIEVKLARTASDADVTHLRWLREKIGHDLLDAVVVTTGDVAYRRPDGIAVVPLALLGA